MERQIGDDYVKIAERLTNGDVKESARIGLCRDWSRRAMDAIEEFAEDQGIKVIRLEAREVEIESNLDHTFILVELEDDKPFILDGTGLAQHAPYFGYEDEAPQHLRNSHLDMINNYRVPKRRRSYE